MHNLTVDTISAKKIAAVVVQASSLVIADVDASSSQVGQKAIGLTKIPKMWVPKWWSIPLDTCRAALLGEILWLDVANLISSKLPPASKLIVRSSAPNENLDSRGYYFSKKSSCEVQELARALQQVTLQVDDIPLAQEAKSPHLVCSPIVQIYLPESVLGHLSNEYRHAQRNVDFLFEVEWIPDHQVGMVTTEPQSFRLDRPVQSTQQHRRIRITSLKSGLSEGVEKLGQWIAFNKLRAHVEWAIYQEELYIVQLDIDHLPPKIKPMSQCSRTHHSLQIQNLKFFVPLNSEEQYANLRKTRSHYLLRQANAPVPDIYIAADLQSLDWTKDFPNEIAHDLQILCKSPLIVRFDVSYEHRDWTNLPTIGPSIDVTHIEQEICSAVQKLTESIPLKEITLVAHHFIPARGAAWSEAQLDVDKVRVDALWGLPDGLQSFAHDTYIWNLTTNTVNPDVRYKDRFIDIDENGQWITRKAYPRLARDWCCNRESIEAIAKITKTVAHQCGGPVRIMWFLDVLDGSDESLIPWIVVEPEQDDLSWWGNTNFWQNNDENLDELRKKASLATSKYISNKESLIIFEKDPTAFDLGGRLVLFQPNETVVRDQSFLKRFAHVIQSNSPPMWSVLFKGSMLAHTPYQLRKLGVDIIPLSKKIRQPRRTYSRKLVRDLIPERILRSGEVATVQELEEADYIFALKQKLIEEALEVAYSDEQDEVVEELADVLAVIRAIATVIGSSWNEVDEEEQQKRNKRGGFEKRLYLQASGYESEGSESKEEGVPGTISVRKLRRGKVGVSLPLIPPLRNDHASACLTFASTQLRVTYKGREVEVSVKTAMEDSQDTKQLSLFEDLG